MTSIRRGLLAGLLAGLILATLNFVTDGTPGRTLPDALHWFGIALADPTTSRFAGFFLIIVLGGVFGLIFGAFQRERIITISRALLSGLVLVSIAAKKSPTFLRNNLYTYYYDQSHFIKEFKRFTGFTPQKYHEIVNEFGRAFYAKQ